MANIHLQVAVGYIGTLLLDILNITYRAYLGILITVLILVLVIWFGLFCVTWRLKRHKEVIIVLQKMAGRKNLQQPRNLQQQPTTRPLPIQPSSDMSNPGAAPWQSVVLGENVAYSKGQEPPPPSYEEVKDNKKADPEYAYIDNQRVLTTSKV